MFQATQQIAMVFPGKKKTPWKLHDHPRGWSAPPPPAVGGSPSPERRVAPPGLTRWVLHGAPGRNREVRGEQNRPMSRTGFCWWYIQLVS